MSAGPPAVAWNWWSAALGLAYAAPAAIVATGDVRAGAALALGVIPAAIIGLLPRRRARPIVVLLGAMTGIPMVVGSLLAEVPAVAVVAVFLLSVGAAALARRRRLGSVALSLSLPLVGVGLSYGDLETSLAAAGLMIAGSVYATGLSMLWPEQPKRGGVPEGGVRVTIGYGVRLGAAAATAAAGGFLLDLEHVGWACAAVLLVMRPAPEMQRLRSLGRVASVTAGALMSIIIVHAEPDRAIYALAIAAGVTGAAATSRSRWYVAPAFTTFLVFLLLLYSDPGSATLRFNERLLETVAGVAIAYFFGLMVPRMSSGRLGGL